jgi:hypothetical protein
VYTIAHLQGAVRGLNQPLKWVVAMDFDTIGASESPEAVAFDLLILIARVEDVALNARGRESDHAPKDRKHADRKWLLTTYRECLKAVRAK